MMDSARRDALLQAMLDELTHGSYAEVSVERARSVAGVTAEEFESEFETDDACLFAAYDRLSEQIVERAFSGCDDTHPWPDRVRQGLAMILEEFATRPQLARVLIRTFPSIRPATYERYVALLARFVPFMREGREYSGVDEDLPAEVELLAVGAAEAIIFDEVESGRARGLPRLMPEILFSILVPFLGPERAADEMRDAAIH
jgi:hypothetical protein